PLPLSFVDTVDAEGNYCFDHIDSGSYTILSRNFETMSSALSRDIPVSNDSITTVPAAKLNHCGSIIMDLSSSDEIQGEYVYIPGTDISSSIDSAVSVFLTDIPAGTLNVIMLANEDTVNQNILRNKITVPAGDTAVIELPLWKYKRKLILNTSSSGANVKGDVYGFPVLIRLETQNFKFSQAKNDGTDIRFVTSGGRLLAYEIERWDSESERAEIWVKVDTIFGNNGSQAITMYWGNPDASDKSNSNMVFDTAAGFQGVWHMSQAGNTTAIDATANHFDGTPCNMNEASSVNGIIGRAQRFDGDSSYFTLSGTADSKLNFPQNGNYALCAWVYTEIIDSTGHYIISKGDRSYNLNLSGFDLWEIYDIVDGSGLQSIYTQPTLKEWKYLTGVRNGEEMRLYVDGVCMDSNLVIKTGVLRNDTYDVQIGKRAESDYGYWNGMLDEVCIMNIAPDPDWIKLCYMNQRKDDKLVVFE
ncbi:MAG TPA: DUF2341 domain-containing protein, partial [Chitinispirillaceae bacterium]|nr:DUF2341 domain-containing protein [Chitinispirillaceae bacterium]